MNASTSTDTNEERNPSPELPQEVSGNITKFLDPTWIGHPATFNVTYRYETLRRAFKSFDPESLLIQAHRLAYSTVFDTIPFHWMGLGGVIRNYLHDPRVSISAQIDGWTCVAIWRKKIGDDEGYQEAIQKLALCSQALDSQDRPQLFFGKLAQVAVALGNTELFKRCETKFMLSGSIYDAVGNLVLGFPNHAFFSRYSDEATYFEESAANRLQLDLVTTILATLIMHSEKSEDYKKSLIDIVKNNSDPDECRQITEVLHRLLRLFNDDWLKRNPEFVGSAVEIIIDSMDPEATPTEREYFSINSLPRLLEFLEPNRIEDLLTKLHPEVDQMDDDQSDDSDDDQSYDSDIEQNGPEQRRLIVLSKFIKYLDLDKQEKFISDISDCIDAECPPHVLFMNVKEISQNLNPLLREKFKELIIKCIKYLEDGIIGEVSIGLFQNCEEYLSSAQREEILRETIIPGGQGALPDRTLFKILKAEEQEIIVEGILEKINEICELEMDGVIMEDILAKLVSLSEFMNNACKAKLVPPLWRCKDHEEGLASHSAITLLAFFIDGTNSDQREQFLAFFEGRLLSSNPQDVWNAVECTDLLNKHLKLGERKSLMSSLFTAIRNLPQETRDVRYCTFEFFTDCRDNLERDQGAEVLEYLISAIENDEGLEAKKEAYKALPKFVKYLQPDQVEQLKRSVEANWREPEQRAFIANLILRLPPKLSQDLLDICMGGSTFYPTLNEFLNKSEGNPEEVADRGRDRSPG